METGASQKRSCRTEHTMSDGMKNVTILATCLKPYFFSFDRKGMICSNVINTGKEFTSICKFVVMETS